jgi:hypothetical protein
MKKTKAMIRREAIHSLEKDGFLLYKVRLTSTGEERKYILDYEESPAGWAATFVNEPRPFEGSHDAAGQVVATLLNNMDDILEDVVYYELQGKDGIRYRHAKRDLIEEADGSFAFAAAKYVIKVHGGDPYCWLAYISRDGECVFTCDTHSATRFTEETAKVMRWHMRFTLPEPKITIEPILTLAT